MEEEGFVIPNREALADLVQVDGCPEGSSTFVCVLVKHFECPGLILQRVVPIEVAAKREQLLRDRQGSSSLSWRS